MPVLKWTVFKEAKFVNHAAASSQMSPATERLADSTTLMVLMLLETYLLSYLSRKIAILVVVIDVNN